jgi:uncharacterized iron-regulated protein
MRTLVVLLIMVEAACGGRNVSSAAPVPGPPTSETWKSALDVDHPLVGKIWRPESGTWVDERGLCDLLAQADDVLLGEQHDNPDHHRLQASIVVAIVARGKRPSLLLEMLEPDDDAAVTRYRADPRASAAGLGAAIHWEQTGWPPWALYEPIAAVAFQSNLSMSSANLPRAIVHHIAHEGISALSEETSRLLGLDRPLPPSSEASLERELADSHCGKLPDSMLAPMALAQRARDGQMASRMLAATPSPVVLIAGAGHARKDRGVPVHIRHQRPEARVISVGFVEVERGQDSPLEYASRYGAPSLPFDFVWFTPRASDDDPCARFVAPKK